MMKPKLTKFKKIGVFIDTDDEKYLVKILIFD